MSALQSFEDNFPLVSIGDFDSNFGPHIIETETKHGEARLGSPRLEVFSVRFLRKDEEYLLPHIFGVIAIQCSSDTSILFNRKVGDPRLVDSEGLSKLIGVRCGLKVDGDIFIKACIFGAKCIACNNHPLRKLWKSKSCQYDKLLTTQISTDLSPIEVQYAVYKEATEAMVDITLKDLTNDSITEFHGTVKVWNTQVPGAISSLFEEDICVDRRKAESAGLSLSLCRRVVAVPFKSLLIVHVEIFHENVIFANKTIKLPAKLDGKEVLNISSKDVTLVVKITWQNDGPDKVQEWITGGESNDVMYQLCECSSTPLKVPRLASPTWSYLSRLYAERDAHLMEEYEASDVDSKYMRLEVFSMRFINHRKLDVSKIYGTFMMDVGSTNFALYNRKVGDPPLIDSEGFVILTAPRHGMILSGSISVFHYLFDLESMVSRDREEWWNGAWSGTMGDLPEDQILSRQVESEFGPIELTFAAYMPGAEALLEVELVNCKVEGPIEISGHINAKNNVVCDSRAVCSLFKGVVSCMSDDIIGGSIVLPLLRQAVVVPLHSKMILDVCIDICGKNFASGELQLGAMMNGTEIEVMKDCYGNDRIKITAYWRYTSHKESLEYCW